MGKMNGAIFNFEIDYDRSKSRMCCSSLLFFSPPLSITNAAKL